MLRYQFNQPAFLTMHCTWPVVIHAISFNCTKKKTIGKKKKTRAQNANCILWERLNSMDTKNKGKKNFEQWDKNKVLNGNWTRVLLRMKQKIFH